MAVDISKVFRANIKAIRMNQSDVSNADALNEELLSKKAKTKGTKNNQLKPNQSITEEAKHIVSIKSDFF